MIHPEKLAQTIDVGFLAPKLNYPPSINLCHEEADDLESYLQAAHKLHAMDQSKKCRYLGKVKMKSGTGRLLQIDQDTPHGPFRLLQAICVKDNTAYLLTTACRLSDFIDYKDELLQSIKSLDFVDPLIPSDERALLDEKMEAWRAEIQKKPSLANSHRYWKKIQKFVQKKWGERGTYFELLALKQIKEYTTN